MSQSEKAAFFQALKQAGVEFTKHYREYTTAELKEACVKLAQEDPELAVQVGLIAPPEPTNPPPPDAVVPQRDGPGEEAPPSEFFGLQQAEPTPTMPPVRPRNPDEMAGARQNTQPEDEPIRTDEQGRVWYQEEVRKPAFPKPRGRRVLTYMDSGAEVETVKVGEYVESFEVAGKGAPRATEVKITLPSYQVGIFKDPRFPFKVITYNDNEGFDLFEVQNFYGGPELVPPGVKRKYVENVLCYDIRTVVRAINEEYRQKVLSGAIKEDPNQ